MRYATLFAVVGCLVATATIAAEPAPIDFNRDVRPILSDKCFHCHGPDEHDRQAELRLDDQADAKRERDGHFVIVPGKPAASELIARITSSDEFERMPPEDSAKQLSAQEIETLRRWINEGAVWSQHWAYVPPVEHPVPEVTSELKPNTWIDNFVFDRLAREGLKPSPEADRVTLIRRLSFDLTGLPPTPEQVRDFVEDRDPNAYEKVVDRLLASPHFGERMAMYWLDLVRYADTVGYHGDQDHNISPYRDYVIEALNDNVPFDRFTREQLAGDLLPEPTIAQKIATGYNRLLQTSHEGGVQPKEYLAIYAADRVRNFSAVWLGGTMGCAQCHDHKYDPYTMKDFYSMQAFFADVDEAKHFRAGSNSLPTARPPEMPIFSKEEKQELDRLEQEIANLDSLTRDAKGDEKKALNDKLKVAQRKRDAIEKSARKTMITVAIEPRTIRILPRGNWLDESGPIVEPAVPEFLGTIALDRRANRLDLADWLVDVDDGVGALTARVQVNRLWYLMFGGGIARVLDDFGGQGEPPTHPELLDNLAVELIDSDWDIKHMIKLLAMSRAYRQSSMADDELRKRDPYNRLIARQSRFRLPAEMVRDNALAISGLLVRELGGASVKPYQPGGYYRHLNFPTRRYSHHDDQRQWRRGVYVHWQRQFLHPMLKAFDAPSREECTAERPRSNTPLAALVLLNDPTFVEAARVFAERILREGGQTDEARLEYAVRWAVSRGPESDESDILLKLLDASRKHFADDPTAAKQLLSTGQAPTSDEFETNELAAWTAVARAILNMHETITRN